MSNIPDRGYGSWGQWKRRRKRQGHCDTFVDGSFAALLDWEERHICHLSDAKPEPTTIEQQALNWAERRAG